MRPVAQFDVTGVSPVPWSVPNIGNRTRKGGGRYRFTTRNKELEFWQAYVKSVAQDYATENALVVSTGPLFVKAEFHFRNDDPATHGTIWSPLVVWNAEKGEWTKKGPAIPDCDNLFKGTIDPLQGVLFGNDAQICVQCSSRRHWASDGARLAIYEFTQEDAMTKA